VRGAYDFDEIEALRSADIVESADVIKALTLKLPTTIAIHLTDTHTDTDNRAPQQHTTAQHSRADG
jgi:hypothetical protein